MSSEIRLEFGLHLGQRPRAGVVQREEGAAVKRNIELVPAREEDLEVLTGICIRAFHTDVKCGAPEMGGPPGYDDVAYQRRALEKVDYLTIRVDSTIVGGFLVLKDAPDEFYLSQLFLDPSCHRQGVGRRAMELMFERYPQARVWRTDTPAWNTRTRPFYLRLGFEIDREEEGLLHFERVGNGLAEEMAID